jgi:hypothetical protein
LRWVIRVVIPADNRDDDFLRPSFSRLIQLVMK